MIDACEFESRLVYRTSSRIEIFSQKTKRPLLLLKLLLITKAKEKIKTILPVIVALTQHSEG